jgi:hypothetical protein
MEAASHRERALEVLETVRCLDCGEVYSKPGAGGTVQKNPGCPACGYVGWIPVSLPTEPGERRRSAGGRQPLLLGRPR